MTLLYCAGVLSLLILGGCQGTAEGLKADTERNAEKASEATRDALDTAGEATKDVLPATTLTPRLKTAITSDEALNDAGNKIDIDSTKETVTINGYVKDGNMRRRAEQIVHAEMDKAGAKQTVINNLEVRPSQ